MSSNSVFNGPDTESNFHNPSNLSASDVGILSILTNDTFRFSPLSSRFQVIVFPSTFAVNGNSSFKPLALKIRKLFSALKLQVPVELIFERESPAEKNLGALIVKVLHEVEVECLPRNLPPELKVDLGLLVDLESQILAKDIKLPDGVELVTGSDEVIALAKEAKEEEVESEPEEIDMENIEVEKKGKDEGREDKEEAETKPEGE